MSLSGYDIPDRLTRDIEALLNADPYNVDIPVVRVEPWDTAQQVQNKIAGVKMKASKRGAALLVLPIEDADDESANLDAAVMTYSIAIQAFTVRELNQQSAGTQKTAYKIIRRAAEWLKPMRLDGITTDFVPDKPSLMRVSLKDQPQIEMWQLNIRASEADEESIQRVGSVSIGTSGALPAVTVTLTCGTAGASIYYTTDGTLPWSGNGTLYAAPFAVAAAGTVRALAFKTGLFPNIVTSKAIS